MGVCCAFIRLSDRNIEAIIRHPKLVYSLLGIPEEPSRSANGFFARLFGRSSMASQSPEHSSLPDPREDDDEGDVDKAWQAIHYLLTGTAGPSKTLLGFIVDGGSVLKGTEIGYGPPRFFSSAQVASIVSEVKTFDRESLRSRYKPKEMDDRDVYPQIWSRDGDEGFDYIWEHFEILRSLLAEAERQKQGLMVYHT
jgi:hypothetical protein